MIKDHVKGSTNGRVIREMDKVKIVATPIQDGQGKPQVRAALRKLFPNFRISGILRDEEENRWVARLIEPDGRIHHRAADEEKPFPLKGLGPDDDEDDEDKPSLPEDGPHKPDEDPDKEDSEDDDPKVELQNLVKKLKDLLPALEKVVGPAEGEDHLEGDIEDVGPTPGKPPMPGPGGPPGPGRPPMPGGGGPGAPPRRPGIPGGRPKAPPVGVPTFSKRIQRPADVSEAQARRELREIYPNLRIASFQEQGGKYVVRLERKLPKR